MGGVTQEQLRLFLTGRITQEVAHALSPRIKELRAASGDPITLYIDSPGGSSAVAEGIRFLIKAPDQDGRRCRLITVVIGTPDYIRKMIGC